MDPSTTGSTTGRTTGPDARCPQCGARQEEGISWCGQCYADLRRREPAPQAPQGPPARDAPMSAAPVSAAPVSAAPVSAAPVSAAPMSGASPEPGAVAGAAAPADPAELDRIAAELLGGLAARPARSGLAGVLDQGAGTGVKWALMVGGALGVTSLALLVLQLFGSVL